MTGKKTPRSVQQYRSDHPPTLLTCGGSFMWVCHTGQSAVWRAGRRTDTGGKLRGNSVTVRRQLYRTTTTSTDDNLLAVWSCAHKPMTFELFRVMTVVLTNYSISCDVAERLDLDWDEPSAGPSGSVSSVM